MGLTWGSLTSHVIQCSLHLSVLHFPFSYTTYHTDTYNRIDGWLKHNTGVMLKLMEPLQMPKDTTENKISELYGMGYEIFGSKDK